MRLYRRRKSNGEWVWWASWTQEGVTRRKSTRCNTKPAAELVCARWERERADPVYAAANAATLGTETALFLTACRGAVKRGKMAEGTLSMYRQKCGTLTRVLGADRRLATIEAPTVVEYLDARREEGIRDEDGNKVRDLEESTLYKEWVALRQTLKHAWRAQRYGRDPASLKPAHFGPSYEPVETFLSVEQADALLGILEGDRRRVVAFVLASGARRSEWWAARAGDIDTTLWTVHVRGKKTKLSDATIPILEPLRAWALIAGQPPFQRWGNSRRDLAVACKKIGAPAVTWNDLRRTFASTLAAAGVTSDVGRRLMRHGSAAMWDSVYARVRTEDLATLGARQIAASATASPVNQPEANQADSDERGGRE
jgi:integrase